MANPVHFKIRETPTDIPVQIYYMANLTCYITQNKQLLM